MAYNRKKSKVKFLLLNCPGSGRVKFQTNWLLFGSPNFHKAKEKKGCQNTHHKTGYTIYDFAAEFMCKQEIISYCEYQ